MKPRPTVPTRVADSLLVANMRACCICHERKHVVIHHIDGNPSNNDPFNLAVLCHDCHSRVTGDEGLGRKYSEAEVRQHKLEWEKKCTAPRPIVGGNQVTEPIPLLYEVTYVSGGEHILYDFELTKGQELFAKISSEDYIDVSICSGRDYEQWLEHEDLMEYEGAEDVRAKELYFTAPRDRTYLLLIINHGEDDVDVTVEIELSDTHEGP